MEYSHIIKSDETDDILSESSKSEIRVTMVKTERKRLSNGHACCIITCAIWNDSQEKSSLSVTSYVINNKREQHQRNMGCTGYDVSCVNIQPNAHVIKGDIFLEEYTGVISAGWVYGLEITDINFNVRDIQFELGTDNKWHVIER